MDSRMGYLYKHINFLALPQLTMGVNASCINKSSVGLNSDGLIYTHALIHIFISDLTPLLYRSKEGRWENVIYHVTMRGWLCDGCDGKVAMVRSLVLFIRFTWQMNEVRPGSHSNINTVKKLHKKSFSCSRGNEVNYKIWQQFLWHFDSAHNCGYAFKS